MTRTVRAVYQDGSLQRKLKEGAAHLNLQEGQEVFVTLSDNLDECEDDLDCTREFLARMAPPDAPVLTLEEIRQSLSGIPGNLSDTVREERDRERSGW